MHLENKGMIEAQKQLSLEFDVAEVVFLFEDALVQHLHRVVFVVFHGAWLVRHDRLLLLAHEVNFGEGALTEETNDVD